MTKYRAVGSLAPSQSTRSLEYDDSSHLNIIIFYFKSCAELRLLEDSKSNVMTGLVLTPSEKQPEGFLDELWSDLDRALLDNVGRL